MFESASSDDSRPADALDLAGLEGVAPGPELAVLVHRVDLGSVADGYELVEVVAACRRLKAWADAVEVAAAATLARHPVCHAPEAARRGLTPVRAAGQLLAARLGLAPTSACDRVATAVQLVDELPDTVVALHQGEIDYAKAAALAVGVRQLDPADGACDRYTGEVVTPDGLRRGLVAEVEARVLPKAVAGRCASTATRSPGRSPPSLPRPWKSGTSAPASYAGSTTARPRTGWRGWACTAPPRTSPRSG